MDDGELEARAQRIVAEWGGVFAPYEAFYIQSIMYAADRVLEAFERYDALRAEEASVQDQVSAVHEALGHAAALSRFFWPSGVGPKKQAALRNLANARAAKLRDAFGLNEACALKDRTLRDTLEHFDERLDRYLLASDAGQYRPLPRIGSAAELPSPGVHVFKLVDPDTLVFLVFDQRFDFGRIREEAARVLIAARNMSESGDRLPRAAI